MLLLLLIFIFPCKTMSNPVVEVAQGKLKGQTCKTHDGQQYFSFKGIPYAKPPVKELRFAIPEPAEPWDGVKDATKIPNICYQFDKDTKSVVGDEDCLYINLYTPRLPEHGSAALPVMVYILGGAFLYGDAIDDSRKEPDYLVVKDVVIVSFNYRVNIFGFYCLQHKDAPGNMGLRDHVQALKWVQENIAKFNGDPNNVTIFGVSSGGASVEYLLLSPLAKGLFHKAISQSGSSLMHWAQNTKIKELCQTVPTLVGQEVITDDDEALKFLKSLPAKQLLLASMKALKAEKFKGGIHFGFVPTVEQPGDWEPFLNQSSYELLSKGDFNKVPYISGICDREGLLMIPEASRILNDFIEKKNFVDLLPFPIDNTTKPELEKRLKNIYLDSERNYNETDAYAIDFFSDVDIISGTYVAASLIAKHNSPTYFYEFEYSGQLNYLKMKYNIDRKGACHADDGGYILKYSILPDEDQLSDTDKLVRDRLVAMWTNFAKYGNPTPIKDELLPITWEPIADTGMVSLVIKEDLKMNHEIYPRRMKLYTELYDMHKVTL